MCNKELISSYDFTDLNTNRNFSKYELVNGKLHEINGTKTASFFVGNIYKITTLKDTVKYVLEIGLAKQSIYWCDKINYDNALELANLNSKLCPVLTMYLTSSRINEILDTMDIKFKKICEMLLEFGSIDFILLNN